MSESSSLPERQNLLGLTRPQLEAFVRELGSEPFRARQLWSWMYKRAAGEFESMTDLAKSFRAQLIERAEIRVPEIVTLSPPSFNPPSVAVKVSSVSTCVSSVVSIVIVCDITPAKKVTVWLFASV